MEMGKLNKIHRILLSCALYDIMGNTFSNNMTITYLVHSMYLRNLNYDTHIMVLNQLIYKFRHAIFKNRRKKIQ